MREIKFRVWDEKNKQFADYEEIEECLSCQSRDGWESSDGMGCCFGINAVEILADCIIEQYTGLKDKSGKEIYEGDILKDNTDDIDLVNAVFWCENGGFWGLKPRSPFADRDWGWFIDRNVEVVGNIHENPELLGEGENARHEL